MTQTVQLNLRIDAELARHLNRIAEQESLRKTDVARKYLVEGVRNWRLEQAIRRYQQEQVSLRARRYGCRPHLLRDDGRAAPPGYSPGSDHTGRVPH